MPFTETVQSVLNHSKAFHAHSSDKSPQNLADEIARKNPELVLINAEGKFSGSSRQSVAGIEVLIWLRVKHYLTCPIILYGFLNPSQILARYPKYLIIHAPGNAYLQLPFEIQELQQTKERLEKRNPLKDKDVEYLRNQYKPYLKPAFSIEEFRHREANWWGILKLWDIQRMVAIESMDNFPYPIKVADNLNALNNVVGEFLYKEDDKKLGVVLDSKTWLTNVDHIFMKLGRNWTRCEINDKNRTDFSFRQVINSLKYELENRAPKILHIDDQANEGWAEIFQYMIYGEKKIDRFS